MVHRRWSNGEWTVEIVARRNRNAVVLLRYGEIVRSRDFDYWETNEAYREAELWAAVGNMKEQKVAA